MTMTLPHIDRFQMEAIEHMHASDGRFIYADPMGARKTATTLVWMRQQAQTSLAQVLLVAPKAVHGHWRREAARWWPSQVVEIGVGDPAQRKKVLDHQAATAMNHATMYITTFESMKRDEKQLIDAGFDTVIFDEGHRLKGRRTAVALVANAITARVRHIGIVTGTPVLNRAAEIWQYLHMLDRKTYSSFWRWVEAHFIVTIEYFGGTQPVKVIGDFIPGQEEVVRAQVRPYLIQRELHDLFDVDLHPWTEDAEFVPIEVELSPKESKLYMQLVKNQWGKLPTGQLVTTANKLALSTRLSQITSEWGALEGTLENGTKVKAAGELIADLARKEPVVVFTEFVETARRLWTLCTRNGLRATTYTGERSGDERDEIVQSFARGKLDVVIGTYAAMREGTDGLQAASSQMVLVDLLWVPGLIEQAVGRLRRSGQRGRVTVYVVFARDTIDATKYEANLRKVNVIETLAGRDLLDVIFGRNLT